MDWGNTAGLSDDTRGHPRTPYPGGPQNTAPPPPPPPTPGQYQVGLLTEGGDSR